LGIIKKKADDGEAIEERKINDNFARVALTDEKRKFIALAIH
jgi:hypothetical protein